MKLKMKQIKNGLSGNKEVKMSKSHNKNYVLKNKLSYSIMERLK